MSSFKTANSISKNTKSQKNTKGHKYVEGKNPKSVTKEEKSVNIVSCN